MTSKPKKESKPDPVIPFGKYRGKRASEVDDVAYLDWMLGLRLHEPFKSDFEEHMGQRQDWKDYDPYEPDPSDFDLD